MLCAVRLIVLDPCVTQDEIQVTGGRVKSLHPLRRTTAAPIIWRFFFAVPSFEPAFDLLGDPIPENFGKRGRPPHMVTEEKRKLVKQLLAFDWTLEKIAAALSITPPTLRKNYFRELKFREEARCRVEAKLLNELMKQVEEGNVSAIDKYFKRLDRHDLTIAAQHAAKRKTADDNVGKKEMARRNASELRGRYSPPEGPRLVQ